MGRWIIKSGIHATKKMKQGAVAQRSQIAITCEGMGRQWLDSMGSYLGRVLDNINLFICRQTFVP